MVKNRKKILIVLLIILFVLFVTAVNPLKFGRGGNALIIPAVTTRTENYDKLAIDVFKITERMTGTEPFNIGSVSDANGVDVSPEDDYVRTNDTLNYTLEVRILGTDTYEDKNGGILKIVGKLPNQGNPILMIFEEQEWMQNTVFNEDKTEIYTEYHFDSNQTPIGNQTITFTVKVLGYKKTITDAMKPRFEVWMEGNKPDDSSSSISSKTVSFTSNPLEPAVKTNSVIDYVRDYKIKGMVFKDQKNDDLYDASYDNKLGGITVKLYNQSGTLIKTTTTDANGNYFFENLTKQEYYVKFELDHTGHVYEVVEKNKGAADVSSVSNSNYQTDLIEFNGNESEIIIDNVNLGIKEKYRIITRVEGIAGGTIEGDELVFEGTDSTENKIKINTYDGYYIHKITINGIEQTVTDNHFMILPKFTDVHENKEVVVSFKTNKIIINKLDENNQPLAGATFELYSGNTRTHYCVSTSTGCMMENINPGTYTLKEVSVPSGYVLSSTVYSVIVDNKSLISVNSNTSVPENKPTVKNKINKLTIQKKDEANQAVAGAIIGLFMNGVEKYRCVSGNDGKCVITKIVPGTYQLKEIRQPNGYVLLKDTQNVVVGVDGFISINSAIKVDEAVTNMKNIPTKIELNLRDGIDAHQLSGEDIVFRLDGPNGYQKDVVFEEEKGYQFTHLKKGDYVLTQLSTLDNVILSTEKMTFTVDKDGLVRANNGLQDVYTYFNYQMPSIKVKRIDVETKEVLEGAKLVLKNLLDNSVLELNVGQKELTLNAGEYLLYEITPPKGYIKSTRQVSISVRDNGELYIDGEYEEDGYELSFTNEPNSIKIRKVDEDGEFVEGAVIAFYKGEDEIERWSSTNADHVIKKLENGTYYVKEISSPDNYEKDDSLYTVEVTNDGVLPSVILLTNRLMPKIIVHKMDKDTNEFVAGAVMEIQEKDGDVIAEFETMNQPFEVRLPYGEYILREKSAPGNYKKSNEEIEFLLNASSAKMIEFTYYNEPYYSIIVKKVNQKGVNLEGALFELYDENKNLIKELETTRLGTLVTKLDKGRYILKEIKGYLLNEEEIEFEITKEEKIKEIKIENEKEQELDSAIIPSPDTLVRKLLIPILFILLSLGIIIISKKEKRNDEKLVVKNIL